MANLKDFATALIQTAPSPATSGTSLVLASAMGVRFPAVPFNAVAHPDGQLPTLDNAERVTVTAVSTDTLTIVRAQGNTTAKSIAAGWRLSNAIFADDIMYGSNVFVNQETPSGSVNGTNKNFTLSRGYISGTLEVYVNGLLQAPTTHTTEVSPSAGTFSLDTAPLTGDIVRVSYYYSATTGGNAQTVNGIAASTTPTANQLYPVTTGLPIQISSVSYGNMATGTTLLPYDDTIPQNNEGDQYMSLSFTPKLATSRLVIEANIQISHSAITNISAALFKDSIANALAAGEVTEETSGFVRNIPIFCDMVAGTTLPITFKIRAGGSSAGTTTFNGTTGQRRFGGIPTSWIKITEYAG